MNIPNVSGISYINKNNSALMRGIKQKPKINMVSLKSKGITKKSAYVQDVDMLVANNEKAFLYDSGKVDITKDTGVRTVKFPSKKAAALYLMKTGWQYVR